MRVTIITKKLDEVVEFLKKTGLRVDDLSAPLSDGADIMLQDIREAIATGGQRIGEQWDPLRPSTIARWGDHPMLRLRQVVEGQYAGALFLEDSIRKFVRNFVGGVEAIAPHAILMERGRTTEMPERPFMRLRDDAVDQTVQFILDYIVQEGKWS